MAAAAPAGAAAGAAELGGCWLSARELAELGLPGLPADKRKMNDLIVSERWAVRRAAGGTPLNRRRAGRGGGWEWHSSLLPESARAELVRRGLIEVQVPAEARIVVPLEERRGAAWAAFERLPAARQAEARQRLLVLQAVEAAQQAGATKTAAVALVAADHALSAATINGWFARVAGVSRADRLAHLAPETRGGGREAEIDPEIWDLYRSDWLRFEKPTHAACYFRVARVARARGIRLPSARTFQRKLERETPPEVIMARREGRERVAQMMPAQIRSVVHLHAMHTVNIDGHVWDVRVQWPDGDVARPVMVGIQDVYSRKMLAWRIDKSESAILTRLAFADLFREWGIPKACVMDNGRAFASKWISGGTRTRYRFKVREDEPAGLLLSLGIENRFATPYHGQAKPVERAWREYCEYIARGPAFAGAYTGSNTTKKPENYGARAIPLAEFEAVVAREIAAMNAKRGRKTETAQGGSFDDAFSRSIAAGAAVGRATDAQMRLALLAAERVRADRKTGAVTFAGNRYWAEGMTAHAGALLTIRFDPDRLHGAIWAYDSREQLIGQLDLWEASGFDDLAAAKRTAKMMGEHRRRVRAAVESEQLLEAAEIERTLAALETPAGQRTQPTVVRPVRAGRRPRGCAAAVPASDFMDRFSAGLTPQTEPALEGWEDRNSHRLRLVE
jgi:hypothetical protein